MIFKSVKEIELKSGLLVYPYRVEFPDDLIEPLFIFAADDAEAFEIAKFIVWRDYDLIVSSKKAYIDRISFYDQYLDEIKGVARIDKEDINLVKSQCF